MKKEFSLQQRLEFLRENPIFWSRFGIEYSNPADWEKHEINALRHKALYEKGIVIHSSCFPLGWVGPDQYDYTLADRLFELLFTTAPHIYFLPRIKLDVPKGWCAAHPEDVFVYAGGPRTKEEIAALVGTEAQGSHPPKQAHRIAQQSFSSPRWVSDASEALRRFVEHVEASPYADRIIGYHISWGTCGETSQWGTWDADPRHKGDYGISATKAFLEYAAKRGKKYEDVPPVEERFFIGEGEAPKLAYGEVSAEKNKFHVGTPTLDQLFYHTKEDERCVLYSEFTRDCNVDATETFCKVVKSIAPEKVTGIFYGYIVEAENCANKGHTGFDRILASPYVDFVAGPKGYYRVGATDPGFGQAIPNSVNLKKLWVDEIDNRTHLCKTNGPKDYTAKNFGQTRGAYWREFSKNVAFHQGYWWMDLQGGWLDSEEIQNEVALLNETSKKLYAEKDTHRSIAEVLLVVDENVMHHMRPNFSLHRSTIGHVGSTVKESGVPIDFYRMADLPELDLSRYKMVIFLNAFYADPDELSAAIARTAPDCHIMYQYAAGILNKKTGAYGVENIKKLTGFSVAEYGKREEQCYPMIYIEGGDGIRAVETYPDGHIKLAERRGADGRTYLHHAHTCDLGVERMRELLSSAGVHLYAPPYCVVQGDSRFLYLLAEKKTAGEVVFGKSVTCQNEFTGEIYRNVTSVPFDLEEGTCTFLHMLKE